MSRDERIRRLAPTIVAALFAVAYLIVQPTSLDLAAHLLRAKLFGAEGFGLWDNWWYAGHDVPGYSVLFPPIASVITPQLAGALAGVATAALFESLVRRHFGERAFLGALWFGFATATNLYTGRLTFAFGLLPAVGMALALQRKHPWLAAGLAVLTALASPVAALFSALAGGALGLAEFTRTRNARDALPGLGAAAASLLPVLLLAIAFPEGGTEPFTFNTLWPIPLIALAMFLGLPRQERALRIGVVLYALGCLASYYLSTPVGSNSARLAPLMAGPVAALIWWRRRNLWLVLVAIPLLYIQWQAPIRDVSTSAGDPAVSAGYYQPLLRFLNAQSGPPFRVEIPFTRFHWEAYIVAPRFPLARGWERQLDIKYNPLFYGKTLDAATYEAWLRQLAIRFVAVPDSKFDFSAVKEVALIDRGLPYLSLVFHSRHWRVYAVEHATPIVQGAARLLALGPNSVSLDAARPGSSLVRVRFTPYWAIGQGRGCVGPDGPFTRVTSTGTGPMSLVIRFSLGRIGQNTPRCARG